MSQERLLKSYGDLIASQRTLLCAILEADLDVEQKTELLDCFLADLEDAKNLVKILIFEINRIKNGTKEN